MKELPIYFGKLLDKLYYHFDDIQLDLVRDMMETIIQQEDTHNELSLSTKVLAVITALKGGRRLKTTNLIYRYPSKPMISIIDLEGHRDDFVLECVSFEQFDTYVIEQPIINADEVTVRGYIPNTIRIDFIYLTDDQLYAVLSDGTTVPYSLSIFDIDKIEV